MRVCTLLALVVPLCLLAQYLLVKQGAYYCTTIYCASVINPFTVYPAAPTISGTRHLGFQSGDNSDITPGPAV